MKLRPRANPGIRVARHNIWDIWISDSGRRPRRDSQMRGGDPRPGTVARIPNVEPGPGHREGRGRRPARLSESGAAPAAPARSSTTLQSTSSGASRWFSAKRLISRPCFSGGEDGGGIHTAPGRGGAWKAHPFISHDLPPPSSPSGPCRSGIRALDIPIKPALLGACRARRNAGSPIGTTGRSLPRRS